MDHNKFTSVLRAITNLNPNINLKQYLDNLPELDNTEYINEYILEKALMICFNIGVQLTKLNAIVNRTINKPANTHIVNLYNLQTLTKLFLNKSSDCVTTSECKACEKSHTETMCVNNLTNVIIKDVLRLQLTTMKKSEIEEVITSLGSTQISVLPYNDILTILQVMECIILSYNEKITEMCMHEILLCELGKIDRLYGNRFGDIPSTWVKPNLHKYF